MKRLLLSIACILTLWGCDFYKELTEDKIGGKIFTHHFISGFVSGDKLEIEQDAEDAHIFYLSFENRNTPVGSDIRNALYEKYGDTTYDRYVSQDKSLRVCYANEFESIEITSSADFGDIKAGESLADVVMFRASSAKPFIDSKYNVPGVWTEEIMSEIGQYGMALFDNQRDFSPIVKSVSDLTSENLNLLSTQFVSLRFTQTPEIKEHTITVSLLDNDKRHTAEIDVVFP